MIHDTEDAIIARALYVAAAARDTDAPEADAMLDLLIERYPEEAQRLMHDFTIPQPGLHLRVVGKD